MDLARDGRISVSSRVARWRCKWIDLFPECDELGRIAVRLESLT
jgi:hypothetical protein